MAAPSDDSKRRELAQRGALHPHAAQVTDPLFAREPFFDRRDAVQVKYEMLRSVRAEGRPVSQAAAQFGFSRPTFYEARAAFERAGLPGLLPAKKGPKRAHKLSAEVLAFIDRQLDARPAPTMEALSARIHECFGRSVHPRSIRRALLRRTKKNP